MKLIKELHYRTIYTRFTEHNNLTFKLTYDNCKDKAMTKFDYNFKIDIQKNELTWVSIADKNQIHFEPIEYWRSQEERKEDAIKCFTQMEDYIKLLYK